MKNRYSMSGIHSLARLISPLIVISLCAGCVSAKYKMAPDDMPPPVSLNLKADVRSVEALIESVIIFGGPASWKKNAYWDEYVVLISNRSNRPATFVSAQLVDFLDQPVSSGNNPWELEEQSRTWVKNYSSGTSGLIVKIGASSLAAGAVIGGSAAAATGLAMASFGAGITTGTAVAMVGAATVVALPVVGVSSLLLNVNRKHKIEDEFNRRRLVLPVTIQPGQDIHGSLFFRVTPGPKRIALFFAGDGAEFDVAVDLKPLSDLHIDREAESQ